MICPACAASGRGTVRTIDARPVQGGEVTRRRKACSCGHRWTTYEIEATAARQLRYLARVGARHRTAVEVPGLGGRW